MHYSFFGLKYLAHLENLVEKKKHCTSRFFEFYVKQKINLTWPNINHKENKKVSDFGQYACGIFLDLQKASDTANHDILLRKLLWY